MLTDNEIERGKGLHRLNENDKHIVKLFVNFTNISKSPYHDCAYISIMITDNIGWLKFCYIKIQISIFKPKFSSFVNTLDFITLQEIPMITLFLIDKNYHVKTNVSISFNTANTILHSWFMIMKFNFLAHWFQP